MKDTPNAIALNVLKRLYDIMMDPDATFTLQLDAARLILEYAREHR